jgi:hypothetical protein
VETKQSDEGTKQPDEETKQADRKWVRYALIPLVIVLCIACIWIIWSYINQSISPEPRTGATTPIQGHETPSPTSIPEETPGSTEIPPTVTVIIDQAEVRSGPGLVYPVLIQAENGLVLRVIGRNAQSTYLLIFLPNNQQGWILVEAVQSKFAIITLPVVKAPPTPTPKLESPPGATPYGQGVLAPPQISGVAPASLHSPGRRSLALLAVGLLSFLIIRTGGLVLKRPEDFLKPLATRLTQVITSLLY